MEIGSLEANEIAGLFQPGKDGESAAQSYLHEQGLLDVLTAAAAVQQNRIQPKFRDLARLHQVVRARKSVCCVELGVGFSTIVLSDALKRNEEDWNRAQDKPRLRTARPFFLFSVDTTDRWIEATRQIVPASLVDRVVFVRSEAEAGLFHGRLCHFYRQLPDVVPDFLYVDGPDPAAVAGDAGGLGWASGERIVMSGDLLVMEPGLTPGALVLVDGRTLNARFLAAHLYRNWSVAHDAGTDITAMELREAPIGDENRSLLHFQLGPRIDAWPDPYERKQLK